MKLGRLRTLRGQLDVVLGAGKVNLVIADGLINYGLRILRFRVWPENELAGFGPQHYQAILSLDSIPNGSPMNAATNSQFAWTYASATAAGVHQHDREIIDPDHVVNRDLFLTLDGPTTSGTYNYLIEAQVVELTDDEAIITIIKETSQS
jgi:hypothetical protein